MEFTETEHIYKSAGGLDLQALVYCPKVEPGTGLPVVIDIHGGAWSSGHRKSGRYYDRALAASGACVVAIDFRQGPDFKHPASIIDILAAVTWCRTTAAIDAVPATLGLVGSSSGGHLAMYAALDPDALDPEASGAIEYVIALWPVSNPLARYQYATARLNEDPATFVQFAPDRLKAGHEAYFTGQPQMRDAAIQNILASKRYTHLPPVFVVQAELDQNVPIMMSQTLAGAWELAGGDVRYRLYEGVAHGFAHAEGPQTDACIEDMIVYIRHHC